MALDAGQSLVRVVVRLLNQPEFFSLRLVQSTLHTASSHQQAARAMVALGHITSTVSPRALSKNLKKN